MRRVVQPAWRGTASALFPPLHAGQPAQLLGDRVPALVGERLVESGPPGDFQVDRGGVEGPAQIVPETIQVGRQREPGAFVEPSRHQVTRADLTAWIPYLASLL